MLKFDDTLLGRELQFPRSVSFRAIIAEIDPQQRRIRIRSLNTGLLAPEWDNWCDVTKAINQGFIRLI